jgi:hypothetical protein
MANKALHIDRKGRGLIACCPFCVSGGTKRWIWFEVTIPIYVVEKHELSPNLTENLAAIIIAIILIIMRGATMGQVTIYLDNETENKLKKAAKSSHISVSKWVASVIEEKITTEWPQDVVKLAGSWKDDFPNIEEIRSGVGHDSPREEL